MVSRLAGGKALPADLLDRILAKTDGVPLFIEELTKSILDSADLTDAGDHWEYSGHTGALAIPLTLRASLMARLDRFQQGTPPDATYTFKHALVQDAAYESLLRGRRRELHGKVAKVIEERWPRTEATEPETLAHHYTEARQPKKAIPMWQRAGSLALGRLALAEAIAHLNKGLELVAALPTSAERDGVELDLRTLSGTTWMALKGWAAQEVWEGLQPALRLAHSLHRNDALGPILWGLHAHVINIGRVADSVRWVAQLMDAAKACGDPDLLILGHYASVSANIWLGNLIKAREHADRMLALYREERQAHLARILNHDPKTMTLIFLARSTWMLGYPEQAARITDAAHNHARQVRHPFDLGWTLTAGPLVFDFLRVAVSKRPIEWVAKTACSS
jgi:hypothetical protein